MSIKKDINACLLVLKSCTEERQSAFDYKLISTLERCLKMESALAVYANPENLAMNPIDCNSNVLCEAVGGEEIAQKALRDES